MTEDQIREMNIAIALKRWGWRVAQISAALFVLDGLCDEKWTDEVKVVNWFGKMYTFKREKLDPQDNWHKLTEIYFDEAKHIETETAEQEHRESRWQ